MVFGQSETEIVEGSSFVDDIASRSFSRGQSLVQPSQSINTDDVFYTPLDSQINPEAMDVDRAVDHTEGEAKQTPAELLEGMRDHYLQALYISKVSAALACTHRYLLSDTVCRHPWPTLRKALSRAAELPFKRLLSKLPTRLPIL
jgi:hypothetical protein